jgi:Flp pilus assembly protein TadG
MSLQLLVIMVPVIFGLMGFALDLGRLYLVRGELHQAADAMALAAASQLIGTAASIDNATAAANRMLDDTGGFANKFNFGAQVAGNSAGALSSTMSPAFFPSYTDAVSAAGNGADGTTATFAQINITADAPLLFWSLLPGGESRRTSIAARAVAGISPPLCTACGTEPFMIAAIDATDTVNFGFGDPTAGLNYTFAFECIGNGNVPALPGTAAVIRYGILNRYDSAGALDESQQMFRNAAAGMASSTSPNPTGSVVPLACFGINDVADNIWPSTSPNMCATGVPIGVSEALCGLYSRFDNVEQPGICSANVGSYSDLAGIFRPDTDVATGTADLYSAYVGNGRRVVTFAIVSPLPTNVVSTTTILGFRQFLLEPNLDGTFLNPGDTFGRFIAQYIGNPAPVRQGYFDDRFQLACPIGGFSGPGKVVLHQ